MSDTPRLDQALHTSAAVIGLLPAAVWPNPLTFAWAGLCMGLVREITEEGTPVTLATVRRAVSGYGSRLDLAFWTLGGLLTGLLGVAL